MAGAPVQLLANWMYVTQNHKSIHYKTNKTQIHDQWDAVCLHFQHEIETLNDPEFKTNANWLQMLTSNLIEEYQDDESESATAALRKWDFERDQLR